MVTGLDVWHQIVPVVVALLGVLIIAILAKKGIKSNVIIGILASAVLYYLFMWEVPSFDMSNISQSFKDFAKVGFLGVFNGDAWDAAFNSSCRRCILRNYADRSILSRRHVRYDRNHLWYSRICKHDG